MDNEKRSTRRFSTAAQVKGLKPEARVYEATDQLARGLVLRVQPSGSRSWFYRYREARNADGKQGKLHRIAIGEYPALTLDAARTARSEWAAKRGNEASIDPHEHLEKKRQEKAAQQAREAAQASADVWTVEKLGEEFIAALTREGKRPRTITEAARQLKKDVVPVIGDVPAASVTPEEILKVLHKIEKRGAMRLRNAVRVTMRWLYSWAAEDGPKHLRHHPNPVAMTRRKKDGDRPKRERRAYTETELKALWPRLLAARGDVYADALSLALLTGTRAEETVSAHWRDVDLEASIWTIPETVTKSRRRHVVLLPLEATDLLKSRVSHGYVFALKASKALGHARTDTLRKRLREHLAALDLDTAPTVHELRHTVCTFVERRWGAGVRQRVANHAREGLSGVYDHSTYDEEAKKAWSAWGQYLSRLYGTDSSVVELATTKGRGT
jgi:integrase